MERGSVKIEVCISEKEESREWREGEKHREERKEGAVDRKKGENRIVEGEDRCSDAMGIKESLSVEEEEEPAASPGTVQQGLEEEEPDYMDMRAGMVQIPLDEQLPLDFQDTFGFLDLMDNSTYNQVNEFSVEPPCYEEEEDDEEQSGYLGGAPSAQSPQWSAPPIQTYRSVTFDPNSRACKSHSLPYKSQSFLPATSFSSSEDEDDGSEEEDGSDEENDRFFCSLPDSLQFQALIQRDMARDANAGDLSSPDLHAPRQERTGTNGHGSSDSSTCEGLQMELESSLPLMDMDRAGGEGGFSDREAQASQWAQTDKMEDRPTHTEEHTKMEDRPTHTEEHTKMKDRPPHTEEHTKMEDRPTHTEEHTKMEDRPTYTEEHTKMEDRLTYTEEHTKMEDRPTYTEEHTKMEDRPTHTEEHTKMEERPTHTEEHTKMEDRPTHTEEHTKMEDRPTVTEEHTKMEDRSPHTEEHTKMEDRPTHTEEHTKMKDRLTHTEEHTKMEDRPPHTEEHTKNEDRPPYTEEHTKMEDKPTLSEERTKMEDRPPHTEEHTKMEDRPTLSEEYTNTARAERDHVATWTDTPGLGCREAEASLTESEEEYEEDENPSVLEHSERDCPAEPRISEHCERDCPAEPRISEHCERDCPADRPAQHTDSGLIGTAGGCQGNTVDQGGCHGDLANRTTQVAEPSLCLLEPQFFLIEPPLSEPQLVYDSHLEQVTIPEEKPPTSVDELEQTCWEGGGQIEREQAREGVGEKNTEDKEEKEKRKEEVGEKLERGVSSGAPGDVNRVRDLRKERGSKEERGGSEQLSHGVGERAAPAPQEDKELQRRSVKEGGERGEAAAGEMGPGVGRALVRSKQTLPKLHQAKAVPVVPPKPQTCKLAALNLRQQLHQRELERGKEGEAERAREERRETEGQGDGKKASRRDGEEEEEQYKAAKDGGTEIQLERWGEDGRDVEKEVKRSSGNSICFDEAVARATEKREREKERGRDGERERRREGEMERRKEEEMERRREGEMEKGRDGERERRREGEREREGGREGEREK